MSAARGAGQRPASALTGEMQSKGGAHTAAQQHLRPTRLLLLTPTICPLLACCLFIPRQFMPKLTLSPRMQFMRRPSQGQNAQHQHLLGQQLINV